jgi:uncharacterized protein (DUF433 family)
MDNLDWSKCPVAERNPEIMSGAWVLRGTRMPVSGVIENIQAGATIDDVMEWFDGLDRDAVEAVVAFAGLDQNQPAALAR